MTTRNHRSVAVALLAALFFAPQVLADSPDSSLTENCRTPINCAVVTVTADPPVCGWEPDASGSRWTCTVHWWISMRLVGPETCGSVATNIGIDIPNTCAYLGAKIDNDGEEPYYPTHPSFAEVTGRVCASIANVGGDCVPLNAVIVALPPPPGPNPGAPASGTPELPVSKGWLLQQIP